MYETVDLVMAGIVSAIIGFALGMSIQRSSGSSATKIATLENELNDEKQKNETYKTQVAQHFTETAGLLKDLTLKYKGIHDHLASGADQLCRDEQGNALLTNTPIEIRIEEKTNVTSEQQESVSAPLDYAPDLPSGQLAEDFGLEKVKLKEDLLSEDMPANFAASEEFAGPYPPADEKKS